MAERPAFAAQVIAAARLATGRLGWSPEQFWEATPAELVLAAEGLLGGLQDDDRRPLASDDLRALMERFPDG